MKFINKLRKIQNIKKRTEIIKNQIKNWIWKSIFQWGSPRVPHTGTNLTRNTYYLISISGNHNNNSSFEHSVHLTLNF